MRTRLTLFLLTLLSQSLFSQGTPLRPTETQALIHVIVTDFQDAPRPGQVVIFESTRTGKQLRRTTNAEGKADILLPKGDTYKILYQGFMDEKEYSSIEIPDEPGLGEGTLQVQMESVKGETFSLDVHFATAQATILAESHPVLQDLVAALKRNPEVNIEISGHTDSDGDAAANLELSRRRAEAVKTWLSTHGIAANRMTTTGYGETRPAASNDTPQGRAQNRRTEVRVLED